MGIVVVPPGPIWVGLRGYACVWVSMPCLTRACLFGFYLPSALAPLATSFSSNCFFSSTCFTLPLLHSTTSTLPLPYHFYPHFYLFFPTALPPPHWPYYPFGRSIVRVDLLQPSRAAPTDSTPLSASPDHVKASVGAASRPALYEAVQPPQVSLHKSP